jgi:transcriptional regulator with XRE-family HTH domain
MSTLSKNLIKYRKLSKKSQKELSDILGIEQATYSKWESGASVKSDFIPKLASLFEIEISELFKEKENNQKFNYFKNLGGSPNNYGYVFVLNDQESFEKVVSFIQNTVEKK